MCVGACVRVHVCMCVCIPMVMYALLLSHNDIPCPFPVYIGGHGLGLPGCV